MTFLESKWAILQEVASNPFEPVENVRFQALNLARFSMLLAIILKDDLSSAVKQAKISEKNSSIFGKYEKKRNKRSSGSAEKNKRSRFTIINYQLIKWNCLFDNIAMALSNIINDNIIKVQVFDWKFIKKEKKRKEKEKKRKLVCSNKDASKKILF